MNISSSELTAVFNAVMRLSTCFVPEKFPPMAKLTPGNICQSGTIFIVYKFDKLRKNATKVKMKE